MMEQTKTPFGTGVQRFTPPRPRLLQMDFLLLAATLGVLGFSFMTLGGPIAQGDGATNWVPRQVAYAVLGLVLHVRCWRGSTTPGSGS